MSEKKPELLPDGAVCRKIRSGEWAVYNSSEGDYKSIRIYELVKLKPQRVFGKLEAPPYSIVTEEERTAFCTLPENIEKGSYVIGYTLVIPSKAGCYYNKPLIKGVLSHEGIIPPKALLEFVLEGGIYIKVTEDIPNGEPGWEIEIFDTIEKESGYKIDMNRQFIIKQKDFGKSYEFFVPCGD